MLECLHEHCIPHMKAGTIGCKVLIVEPRLTCIQYTRSGRRPRKGSHATGRGCARAISLKQSRRDRRRVDCVVCVNHIGSRIEDGDQSGEIKSQPHCLEKIDAS